MIPEPRLRSGSPGLGEWLCAPSSRTTAGSASSKRDWGLRGNLGGFSSIFQGVPGARLPCRWERGQDLGFGLRRSPLLGFPSNLRVGFFIFWCFVFSQLSPCAAGVCWELGSRVFTQTAALWRCAALSPWPEGQGGTRRWHRLPPPPPAWERSHLSCQHRPLGRRADVCVLLHVGVRANLPLPRAGVALSRRAHGVFCRESFAVPFPLHPHPPRLQHRLHLFPLTQHLQDGSQLSMPVPVPCPLLAGRCHRARASSAGFGAFRGDVAVNFVAPLNGQALPASSQG